MKFRTEVSIIKDGMIVNTYDLDKEPQYRYQLQDIFFEVYDGS